MSVQIVNAQTGLALDIPVPDNGEATTDYVGVIQSQPDTSSQSQQWNLTEITFPFQLNWYQIQNVATGKLLTVPGGLAIEGLVVVQVGADPSLSDNQIWHVVGGTIKNRATGMFLEAPYGIGCAGIAVIQSNSDGENDQNWNQVEPGVGP